MGDLLTPEWSGASLIHKRGRALSFQRRAAVNFCCICLRCLTRCCLSLTREAPSAFDCQTFPFICLLLDTLLKGVRLFSTALPKTHGDDFTAPPAFILTKHLLTRRMTLTVTMATRPTNRSKSCFSNYDPTRASGVNNTSLAKINDLPALTKRQCRLIPPIFPMITCKDGAQESRRESDSNALRTFATLNPDTA